MYKRTFQLTSSAEQKEFFDGMLSATIVEQSVCPYDSSIDQDIRSMFRHWQIMDAECGDHRFCDASPAQKRARTIAFAKLRKECEYQGKDVRQVMAHLSNELSPSETRDCEFAAICARRDREIADHGVMMETTAKAITAHYQRWHVGEAKTVIELENEQCRQKVLAEEA